MIKHLVMFSSGLCSWCEAKRTVARCMSNHLIAAEKCYDNLHEQWKEGRYEWGAEYVI